MDQPLFELYFDDSCKSLGVVQEGFSDTLGKIWNTITTFFRTLWTNIVKMYNNAISTIKTWFRKLLGVDKIEKENADLKSQVQSLKAAEEKSKKDLADANAKLKELEETERKTSDALLASDTNLQKSRTKASELEKEKKCLEKYIKYIEYGNTEFPVFLNDYKCEEIIKILRQSNQSMVFLTRMGTSLVRAMEKSDNFDDFISKNCPNIDPKSIKNAYDIIENYDFKYLSDKKVDFNFNDEAFETETLDYITPTYIKVKNIALTYKSSCDFLDKLQKEVENINTIDFEYEFNLNKKYMKVTDERGIKFLNNAIQILFKCAKKREEANRNVVMRAAKLIKDFAEKYKDIKDIDFHLNYETFKERYLDSNGEYTSDLDNAIASIHGIR